MAEFVNSVAMRFLGLQRSGNHAIINWIGAQFPKPRVYLLNNVKIPSNPFLSASKESGQSNILFNGFRVDRVRESEGQFVPKDCLLCSFEDYEVFEVFDPVHIGKLDGDVGKSECKRNILILRDPFNLFASRWQREKDGQNNRIPLKSAFGRVVELWKAHAREYLGETNYMDRIEGEKVVISYNSWFASGEYRKDLAASLGLHFTDAGYGQISKVGGGSSFYADVTLGQLLCKSWKVFNPKAVQQLIRKKRFFKLIRSVVGRKEPRGVLSRWEHLKKDDLLDRMLADSELMALSERIFGKVIDDVH